MQRPPTKPPLQARTSSKLLEVGSATPSRSGRSGQRLVQMGKSPSFVSTTKGSDGGDERNSVLTAQFIEKYNRKYPDKELPFTDKDRAAAMAMGTKDIKVSLQVKKKRERKQDEPGEREFQIRFALVEKELRKSNANRALRFVNKAMEYRPNGRECFVARSRCYLLLGQIPAALADAETALTIDKDYMKAVFAKAEALFALGDFEHALVYYHRGHQLRPELEEFRLGIQKGQEAILQVIGDGDGPDDRKSESTGRRSRTSPALVPPPPPPSVPLPSLPSLPHPPPYSHGDTHRSESLGDLNADIEFMQRLFGSPELNDMKPTTCQQIKDHVKEALDFLQSRQEFWEQRRPRSHQPEFAKRKQQPGDSRCLTAQFTHHV